MPKEQNLNEIYKNDNRPFTGDSEGGVPFRSAEEAWFWFIQAQAARDEGARFTTGQGLVTRPCEPMDILKVVDRLYRNRRLIMDHLLVMRHYGRRMMAPDARRVKEAKAHKLWSEALERIEEVLVRKGIVEPDSNVIPFPEVKPYRPPQLTTPTLTLPLTRGRADNLKNQGENL